MYTGCNWIYENHRPEPNHNLQKSDFSHPLLTYHHKQMQGMGSSNNVSSTTYSYHSQEAFPSQSNSMYTSSQPLQNHHLRYPQNSQINSTPMQNYNYNGSGNNQSIRKPQPPRIRVRDVQSLNNNTTHPSLLRNTLLQSQKQQYYPYNSTNVPSTCCSQTQSHCFNQDRVPVPDYNYTYQHYGASPTHLSYANSSQQHLHHSAMYQQPNSQNPCNAQLQYNTLHQVKDQSSSQLSARLNYPTQVNTMPQKEFNNQSIIQGGGMNSSVAWNRNTSEIPAQAEQRQYCKENRPDMSAIQTSREPSSVPDSGGRRQELAYVPLLSPISPCNERTTPMRVSRGNQEANRIVNSQTSQRASCVESGQTMTCLSPAQTTSMGTRNSNEKSNNQSHAGGLPESGDLCQEQNSLIRAGVRCDEHGVIDPLTSKQPKDVNLASRNPSRRGGEEDTTKNSVSECLARLKQEKVETVEMEKSVEKEEGISEESEIMRKMKTEVECSQAEAEPKDDVEEAVEVENVGEEDEGTEEVEEEEEGTEEVEEIGEKKETREAGIEVIQGEQKYRSEIDRRKLNMLIQFVEKEEREEDNSVCLERIIEEKKNRRRKLSKECVIRNKNCGKEFIAVKSVKNLRKDEDLSECEEKLSTEKRAEIVECKSKKDSISDNGEMLEERKIVNIMKAFQSLGHHFCANCNFIAPIEAIWINVMSGELRCVHCFRKMVLNTEKSFEKTKKFHADKETQSDPVESGENKNTLEGKTKREPGKEDMGDGSGGKCSCVKVEVDVKKEERVGGSRDDEKDRESSGSDELELEKKEILGHVLGKQRKKEKGMEERGKKRSMSVEELPQEKVKRIKESCKEVKERKAGSEERCINKPEWRSCDKSVTGEKAERKEEKTKRRKEEEAKKGGSETEASRKQKERSWEKDKEESAKKRVKRSSELKEGTREEKRNDKDKACSNVIIQEEIVYELLGNLTEKMRGVKGSEPKEGKEEWKRRKEKESESPKAVKKSSGWKHEKPKTEKSERKEKHYSKKCDVESKERFHSHKKLSDGHHRHKEKQNKGGEKHSEHRRTQEQRAENRDGRKERKEKAMESVFEEKKKAKVAGKTISKGLQEKLERKTKKLSWSLLDQT